MPGKASGQPPTSVFSSLLYNAYTLAKGSFLASLLAHWTWPYMEGLLGMSPIASERILFVLGSLLVHESLFGLNSILLSDPPSLKSFKIPRSPGQMPPEGLTARAIKKSIVSHLTLQPLALYYLFALFKARGSGLHAPLPSFLKCWQHLALCQFSECLLFYVSHRLLHTKPLYRFHKMHHEFRGPNGFAAEYASPVEQLCSNYFSIITAPLLLGTHVHIWWIYFGWRLVATYERHSGYSFKASWLGRLGLLHGEGALFHDLHHTANTGNFGSGLDIFDVVCGTRVYAAKDAKARSD